MDNEFPAWLECKSVNDCTSTLRDVRQRLVSRVYDGINTDIEAFAVSSVLRYLDSLDK